MKLLYMDETYADAKLPVWARAICLSGLLVPAASHSAIRTRFYDAVADAVGREPNTVPMPPKIHAADLLPGSDDGTRIVFLNAIVDIILDFELTLYRVGYRPTPELMALLKTQDEVLGLAFNGMLHLIEDELANGPVWPVMETNQKSAQDRAFAGSVQFADHVEAHVGSGLLSRDQAHLGEVLYCTKRSIHGALVDCAAYLLNVRTVRAQGLPLAPFKQRLVEIAERLAPSVRFDEIIQMQHCKPPPGGPPTGPYRYVFPITPSDNDTL